MTLMKSAKFTEEDLAAYQTYIEKDYVAIGGTPGNIIVMFEAGQKYIKVISRCSPSGRSAHSFIDADGNIWKAASWKAPAKNFTRGNIITRDFDRISWTGAN